MDCIICCLICGLVFLIILTMAFDFLVIASVLEISTYASHTARAQSTHEDFRIASQGFNSVPPSLFFLRKGRMSQIHRRMGINTTERLEAPSLHLHNSFMPSRGSINGLSEMLCAFCSILDLSGLYWQRTIRGRESFKHQRFKLSFVFFEGLEINTTAFIRKCRLDRITN